MAKLLREENTFRRVRRIRRQFGGRLLYCSKFLLKSLDLSNLYKVSKVSNKEIRG
jgi:hypothetical protein